MMFPDGFLQEIKYRNDIEDIIARYVNLKQSGANLVGCCPFHSEKTPSFSVNKTRKFFYCFGCGAGGDVITFMMKIENLDYISAVARLADFAKLEMPEDTGEARGQLIKKKRIYEMNREAALYFHERLTTLKNIDGDKARGYLIKRGLKGATIKHFGLGYSPGDWNGLTKHLSEKGYSKEEQKTACLCTVTKKGEYIDFFRGRLMFPIIDVQGNVIAFGGRALDDNGPKYLNSPDTPAFKKSRNLYALNFAKNSKLDYLIMCEGYMDVISMHQAGFTNAVATLGTAVTSEQARLIDKYTKRVVLAYDSDDAGRRAMQKAAALLSDVGIEVRVLKMDMAKDPDEFINKYGREKLAGYLAKPKGYVETKFDIILEKYNIDNADESVKAINELCAEIALINSEVAREVYGIKIAEHFKLPRDALLREIKKRVNSRIKKEKSSMINEETRRLAGYGDRVNPDYIKNPAAAKLEEAVLGQLLNFPEEYKNMKDKINGDFFLSEFHIKIFNLFKEAVESGENFDTALVTKDLSEEETGRVTRMIINHQKNNLMNLLERAEEQSFISAKKNIKEVAASGDDFVNYIRNKQK